MYHFFLERRLRFIFGRLSAGDYPFITRQFRSDAEHWFSGSHAMSGRRVSHARILDWYQRLATVFPGITFQIQQLIVSGPPWNSVAAVEWIDTVNDRQGRPLPNRGVFLITIKWGKVSAFRVYCDTAQIEKNLEILASQGVEAAAAAPIEG